jgi:SAM-dependent methyltransferase
MNDDYNYPDAADRITNEFIVTHEPYPGYWAQSEAHALDLAGHALSQLSTEPAATRAALDAGCGQGRLLLWLAQYAAHLTALDPDAGRLAEARAAKAADDYVGVPLAEYSKGPFDLVLCSHVLQHLPTGQVEPALRDLHRLTRPGGLVVLLFARAPVGEERFSIQTPQRSHLVDEAAFNTAAEAAEPGRLAGHSLDPQRLKRTCRSIGLAPEWERTFHVLDDRPDLPLDVSRDDLANASPHLRRRLGTDMITILRRR